MNVPAPELILYGRAGCHLCQAMEEELRPHLERLGLKLRQVDISGHRELEASYGWEVPVLAYGSEEICRHFFDLKSFQSKLSDWPRIP